MIGTKIIKVRPLVPDLDLQMSKKRYFDIPKAKLGPNGPILMILRPNTTFLSMPCQIEWLSDFQAPTLHCSIEDMLY